MRDKLLRLQLILITLADEDDAYLIFETLNTRGSGTAHGGTGYPHPDQGFQHLTDAFIAEGCTCRNQIPPDRTNTCRACRPLWIDFDAAVEGPLGIGAVLPQFAACAVV